jgi:hypothetical protein
MKVFACLCGWLSTSHHARLTRRPDPSESSQTSIALPCGILSISAPSKSTMTTNGDFPKSRVRPDSMVSRSRGHEALLQLFRPFPGQCDGPLFIRQFPLEINEREPDVLGVESGVKRYICWTNISRFYVNMASVPSGRCLESSPEGPAPSNRCVRIRGDLCLYKQSS